MGLIFSQVLSEGYIKMLHGKIVLRVFFLLAPYLVTLPYINGILKAGPTSRFMSSDLGTDLVGGFLR